MLRFKDGMTVEQNAQDATDLGQYNEDKFYRLYAENHDEKYKWRKMVEMKSNKDFTGTIYQKPSDDCLIDTL